MIKNNALYDRKTPFEQRLGQLLDWIEARRKLPTHKDDQLLIAHLLATDPISLPLHLIFPGEEAMDLSIRHPKLKEPDAPHVDDVQMMNFIWRHSSLDRATVDRLMECQYKLMALMGLVPWDAAFETHTQFQEARLKYEVIVKEGVDGRPVFEDEHLWYVAARDCGISREDTSEFGRLHMIHLFALGVASDDVGTAVLK